MADQLLAPVPDSRAFQAAEFDVLGAYHPVGTHVGLTGDRRGRAPLMIGISVSAAVLCLRIEVVSTVGAVNLAP
jgi:hypothetical protein